MNHKSIAISSSLIALTLAVPPPLNMVVGVPMFVGLKLYKTAIIFLSATTLIYSGQIIGFITSNQISKVVESQETVAYQVANMTMDNPELFPYVAVGLITTLLLEVVVIMFFFILPTWIVRKKVYPHIKNRL